MPLLTPSNRKRIEKIQYRASRISSEEIKVRAAWIASQWTSDQRLDRKLLGTVKRAWLFRLIIHSSNDQE